MNNPYYHWVLPNYLVDYNNRYNDYVRYNYDASKSNSINNYSPVGQKASAQQANYQQNQYYLYQQQSQSSPQQPQQNNRQIPPLNIENYQLSPKSTSYLPISLQLPQKTGDPLTPLVTPNNIQQTHQCLQVSSSKSTTDDPLNILKVQPDNYLRSSQAPTGYYDQYMYSRPTHTATQIQPQQSQQQKQINKVTTNQHFYQHSKNSK
jgi:hypothetical protein